MQTIRIKRVYEMPSQHDGCRILVDRLWPRGIAKASLKHDLWLKEVAPSTELRKWFAHDENLWEEFHKRYTAELGNNDLAVDKILTIRSKSITLLYSAKNVHQNQAVVLQEFLVDKLNRNADSIDRRNVSLRRHSSD